MRKKPDLKFVINSAFIEEEESLVSTGKLTVLSCKVLAVNANSNNAAPLLLELLAAIYISNLILVILVILY